MDPVELMEGRSPRNIGEGVLFIFLKIGSWIYGRCVGVLLWLHEKGFLKKHQLPKPVISVGNLTWGGVGKTPLVIWIARYLKEQNRKVVILTRGYMSSQETNVQSDEAAVIREQLAIDVFTGADRIKSAGQAMSVKPDVFVLDDAFQQWKLKKDLEIVAIDATNPFGNRNLIPAGILREPLASLKRADLFVLTKTDQTPADLSGTKNELRKINPQAPFVECIHAAKSWIELKTSRNLALNEAQGKAVLAFCSIGNPNSFEQSLSSLGVKMTGLVSFRDHHVYAWGDIQKIRDDARRNKVKILVTTQKDAVKIKPFLKDLAAEFQVLCLTIQIQIIQGEHELTRRIDRLF